MRRQQQRIVIDLTGWRLVSRTVDGVTTAEMEIHPPPDEVVRAVQDPTRRVAVRLWCDRDGCRELLGQVWRTSAGDVWLQVVSRLDSGGIRPISVARARLRGEDRPPKERPRLEATPMMLPNAGHVSTACPRHGTERVPVARLRPLPELRAVNLGITHAAQRMG